jgi:ParB family chromosome partitioning protein
MSARRGMGRGLAAILPESGAAGPDLRELPLDSIKPNPRQPRTRMEPASLKLLAESVATSGVVQPVIVRSLANGSYELLAGERRWLAARQAGLDTVPAVVRAEDETRRLETALVENMVREDLNPVDEARACAALVEELGLTKEEVARRVGRSRVAISNLIRLLDLPDVALKLIEAGELSEGHGRAILLSRSNDDRRRLAQRAATEGWSVRETEKRARGETAKPRRRAGSADPDLAEALTQAEEKLSAALGTDVRVRSTRDGIRADLSFEDIDELLALARRLSRRR